MKTLMVFIIAAYLVDATCAQQPKPATNSVQKEPVAKAKQPPPVSAVDIWNAES